MLRGFFPEFLAEYIWTVVQNDPSFPPVCRSVSCLSARVQRGCLKEGCEQWGFLQAQAWFTHVKIRHYHLLRPFQQKHLEDNR